MKTTFWAVAAKGISDHRWFRSIVDARKIGHAAASRGTPAAIMEVSLEGTPTDVCYELHEALTDQRPFGGPITTRVYETMEPGDPLPLLEGVFDVVVTKPAPAETAPKKKRTRKTKQASS